MVGKNTLLNPSFIPLVFLPAILFFLPINALAAPCSTLKWDPPQTYADGSQLKTNHPTGYLVSIHHGVSDRLIQQLDVTGANSVTIPQGLADRKYVARVAAYIDYSSGRVFSIDSAPAIFWIINGQCSTSKGQTEELKKSTEPQNLEVI